MKGNGILFQIVLTKCEIFFSKDWGKCLRYVTWPIYTNFCGLNFTFTKIGTMKMPIGTNNKYVETYRKKDSTTINDGCSLVKHFLPDGLFRKSSIFLIFFWFAFISMPVFEDFFLKIIFQIKSGPHYRDTHICVLIWIGTSTYGEGK